MDAKKFKRKLRSWGSSFSSKSSQQFVSKSCTSKSSNTASDSSYSNINKKLEKLDKMIYKK